MMYRKCVAGLGKIIRSASVDGRIRSGWSIESILYLSRISSEHKVRDDRSSATETESGLLAGKAGKARKSRCGPVVRVVTEEEGPANCGNRKRESPVYRNQGVGYVQRIG